MEPNVLAVSASGLARHQSQLKQWWILLVIPAPNSKRPSCFTNALPPMGCLFLSLIFSLWTLLARGIQIIHKSHRGGWCWQLLTCRAAHSLAVALNQHQPLHHQFSHTMQMWCRCDLVVFFIDSSLPNTLNKNKRWG